MRVRRLDEVLAAGSTPPVSVMKIDVEGAELAVVRGASQTIERDRPFVVFEENDPACGAHLAEAHGYRLFRITPDGYVEHATAVGRAHDVMAPNVLAVPPARPPRLLRPAEAWAGLRSAAHST